MTEVASRNNLNGIVKAGHASENNKHVIIGEKRYNYDGLKFSKILETKTSSLYISMAASLSAQATPRTVNDKIIDAVHNNGAKLETSTENNNTNIKS